MGLPVPGQVWCNQQLVAVVVGLLVKGQEVPWLDSS